MTTACRWMLRGHFETLIRVMNSCSDDVHAALDYLTASLHLERIADLATNIAEDVVFMVEARVIRHGHRMGSGSQDTDPDS